MPDELDEDALQADLLAVFEKHHIQAGVGLFMRPGVRGVGIRSQDHRLDAQNVGEIHAQLDVLTRDQFTDPLPASVHSHEVRPEDFPSLDLIAEERLRQVTSERWSSKHDDQHDHGELVHAACQYASIQTLYVKSDDNWTETVVFMPIWPHDWKFKTEVDRVTGQGLDWHHQQKIEDDAQVLRDRIRDLTKAGALIAAEIDRLARKSKA